MKNTEGRVKQLQDPKKKYNIRICVTGVAEGEEIKDEQEKDWKRNGGELKWMKKISSHGCRAICTKQAKPKKKYTGLPYLDRFTKQCETS